MKYSILLAFGFFSLSLFAQNVAVESIESMSKGSNPAYTILLDATAKKTATQEWSSYMKNFKGKTRTSGGEVFTDNAKLPTFSSNTVDVYAKFLELAGDEGTQVIVWFDLGGAYMSSKSHPEKVESVNEFLYGYDKKVKVTNAQNYLEMQEASLKSLEKEWTKLLRDKENYLKKIEDAKDLIAKHEQLIIENTSAQEVKIGEIDGQKKNVSAARSALQKVQ